MRGSRGSNEGDSQVARLVFKYLLVDVVAGLVEPRDLGVALWYRQSKELASLGRDGAPRALQAADGLFSG
jgi:hypothetical protein